MLEVLANVCFPMPAAFAFLAVGFGNNDYSFLFMTSFNVELRNVYQLL